MLAAQTHRRFIKTHTSLDGLPWDDHVTYLTVGRDPRERMMALGVAAVGDGDLEELLAQGEGSDDPRDQIRFFRRGGRGDGAAMMTEQELARYDERVAELAGDAALATWIHEGWLAGTGAAD